MPSSRSRRFSITPVAALTIVALVAMVLISGVGFRASVQGINFEISQRSESNSPRCNDAPAFSDGSSSSK